MIRALQALHRSESGLRARLVALGLGLALGAVAIKGSAVALSRPVGESGVTDVFAARDIRADIIDRNGELLATSVDVYSLFADPRAIWDPVEVARELGRLFGDIDEAALAERLANRERAFVWVRRGLTPRQRQAVFELGLEGLGFRRESRRAYPRGTLAGHVLGFAGIDGQGLAGVEFALDDRLAGGGRPLRLTLHSGVQFALEAELSAAAAIHDIDGGAGVVIEARTGEVFALASWPPINPNRASELPGSDAARLNRAAGAVYELGSVFKPLTVAAALEAGVLHPDDRFDLTKPLEIAGKIIEDHHARLGPADAADIVAESSNVGTVRIAMLTGSRRQQAFYRRLGLLSRAPVELASSAAPILPQSWDELTSATTSYGHGIAVSPLAFASGFSALANDGEIMPATLLKNAAGDDSARRPRRVMAAPTARLVTAMLREAVTRGTGTRADIAGYRIAGKTGTAEKPVPGGYSTTENITAFAAVFPADRPEYAVLIVLDHPKAHEADGVMVGGTAAYNAAPTAGRVIERIAPLLGVKPRFEDERPRGLPIRSVSETRSNL